MTTQNVKKQGPFGHPRKKTAVTRKDEIKSLLLEDEANERRLPSNNYPKNITVVLKKFAKLMGKANINAALKLLKNNMTNGILSLYEKTLNCLKQKHAQSQPAYEEKLINGE